MCPVIQVLFLTGQASQARPGGLCRQGQEASAGRPTTESRKEELCPQAAGGQRLRADIAGCAGCVVTLWSAPGETIYSTRHRWPCGLGGLSCAATLSGKGTARRAGPRSGRELEGPSASRAPALL